MKKSYIVIFILFMILPHGVCAASACEQSFSLVETEMTEERAKQLGYTPIFYDGLNAVHQLTQLGQHLRSRSVDLKTTHIENLEPLIPIHIRHIQEGLKTSGQIINLAKLADLYQLKKEAQIRIKNKQVTLYWWLLFNTRLAALATRSADMESQYKFLNIYKTHDDLADYIENPQNQDSTEDTMQKAFNLFPETVVLPTHSKLGILALNQAVKNSLRIVPAELPHQTTHTDGSPASPIAYFEHDLQHILSFNHGTPLLPEDPELNNRIIYNMERLPLEERKKAEVMYFMFTHEFHKADRPTISQMTNARALLQAIHDSVSDINLLTFDILVETQLLNTLNENRDDIYQSEFTTNEDLDVLQNRYDVLMSQSVEIFSQIARKALESADRP